MPRRSLAPDVRRWPAAGAPHAGDASGPRAARAVDRGLGRPAPHVSRAPLGTERPATVTHAALDLVVGRHPAARDPRPVAARDADDGGGVVGEVVSAGPSDQEPDAAGAAPGAGAQTPADLAGLADRLWDHLEQRLRRSLLLERERRGVLPDL
ncbi:hypothetical protein [Cellulomonas sp. S1-8]|uniref:hypothetical protein n=1 Tax=Cellulomonas sp. S1-8 TaxID=2904790 RepID=UPI0022438158|nr:hypothetical protein [Cellulomonas sp. S1-8]UZN02561.1 hypothetical protein OKX07_16090 [Cellulomonas sp. S1-8]